MTIFNDYPKKIIDYSKTIRDLNFQKFSEILIVVFKIKVTVMHLIFSLGVTAGVHRLWSHRSYKAHPLLQFFLLVVFSGQGQHSVFHWARDHRLHHKKSDTNADPHNINRGFFFSHIGWLMVKKNRATLEEMKKIDISDLKKSFMLR